MLSWGGEGNLFNLLQKEGGTQKGGVLSDPGGNDGQIRL